MAFLIEKGTQDVDGVDISDEAIRLAKENLRRYLGAGVDERLKVGDMAYLSRYYGRDSFSTIVYEGTFHQTNTLVRD